MRLAVDGGSGRTERYGVAEAQTSCWRRGGSPNGREDSDARLVSLVAVGMCGGWLRTVEGR
jgi:hypothetical protein